MSSFASTLTYRHVPHHVFEQMRRSLTSLQSAERAYLSELDLKDGQPPVNSEIAKFALLSVGPDSLLLLAQSEGEDSYLIRLCTEITAIQHFLSLSWLADGLKHDSRDRLLQFQDAVDVVSSPERSLGLSLRSQELMAVVHRLMLEMGSEPPASLQALSAAAILQRIVSRLQQSQPLFSLITETLEDVCNWLHFDRLLIYQIVDPPTHETELQPDKSIGPHVTYEARGHPSVASVLSYSDAHCVNQYGWGRYESQSSQQPSYCAIEDITSHYQQHPCLVSQLQQAQVGSQLVAPVWLDGKLWGLLIGHHCLLDPASANRPQPLRHWQPWEGDFLVQVAEHLAIAIRQDKLQQQLQHQKLILKAQVEDRTQNLKDALMAAEAANTTKSEFLATMSHELRTPLTYIIGMSATLLRWSFGDLSPRQRDYLNTIHSSGEQLLDIINDILEVAKIEAGRTVLEINDFSLSNLTRSSLESFREEAQEKEVDLRINLRLSEAEDIFRADPRRIRQILANLLSNAVKFTDRGGRISLRVWRDPQNVIFQVEDTGIGIPETQQAALFETFKQLETTRQRQYSGTGLGLALTKQLVELHNGSIQVVSTPGKGSMFTVRIPIQHPDSPSSTFQSDEPITGRIILLEDDESSASLVCDLLTAANYQVIWVIEGSRIVHQVEILQPVAIILNYHLVSGNSQYIVDDLKRYVATSNIKVISLMEVEDTGHELPLEGFDDYLIKPIEPTTLLSKIQMLTAS